MAYPSLPYWPAPKFLCPCSVPTCRWPGASTTPTFRSITISRLAVHFRSGGFPMLRPSAILGVLFAVTTLASPSLASGDSSVDAANRYEEPHVLIKRILDTKDSDRARLAALVRFVKVGDPEYDLVRRLGKQKSDLPPLPDPGECYYSFECGLDVK